MATRYPTRRAGVLPSLLVVVLVACMTTAVPVAQEVAPEYRVKAEYLYNFVKYVEWPEPSNRTVRICVAGQNPFGSVLEELIRNERILRMPLTTKTILAPEPGCDVIFAPRTSNMGAYIRASAGMPILTVGETPRFIEQGGIIRFFAEDDGVRFEINRTAAERVGLRISSRLLQLAQITARGPDER
jgi:hypothetical protein